MKVNSNWINQQRVPDDEASNNETPDIVTADNIETADAEVKETPTMTESVSDTVDAEPAPAADEPDVSASDSYTDSIPVIEDSNEPVSDSYVYGPNEDDLYAEDTETNQETETGTLQEPDPDAAQEAPPVPVDKKAAKAANKAAKKNAKQKKKKSALPWIILGSLIVSGAAYGVAIHIQTQALSAFDRTAVYVAGNTMPDGHVIDESEAAVITSSVELPIDAVPADAVTDLSMIVNSAARYDITPGTILCTSMFETVDEMQAGLREPVIAGFRSEDIYQVVGGVLRPGDTISIYTIDNVSEIGMAMYEGTLRWDNIRVQDVFDTSGMRINSTDKITPAARVNIYMDKSEVEDFYAKLAQGSLRVVVHCD